MEKRKSINVDKILQALKLLSEIKEVEMLYVLKWKKDDQRTISLIRVIQVKAPRPERCIAITNLTTRKK